MSSTGNSRSSRRPISPCLVSLAEMSLHKIFALTAAFRERHPVYIPLCQLILAAVTFYCAIVISHYDPTFTPTPRAAAVRSLPDDADSTTPYCKTGARESLKGLDALLIVSASLTSSLLPFILHHRSEKRTNSRGCRKLHPTACFVLAQPYSSSLSSPSGSVYSPSTSCIRKT
ncbi:hypothetical protein IF1G_10843 [Cordyceps javanica]|uniref:Uncharacterized protein n=1 Tax=Cordyceps javanica TaxID=43265 RepID=A0A545UM43_9HYPO|nr:hypothetical protein IF1G_10843 [Cordyceps javanica]